MSLHCKQYVAWLYSQPVLQTGLLEMLVCVLLVVWMSPALLAHVQAT
jgi:hypothetical protein